MKIVYFLISVFLTTIVNAQDIQIRGVVSDAKNLPLPGVNVLVKNSTNGAVTSFDGDYSLSGVSKNDIIVFSYIGFATQEIVVGDQTTINVVLEEDGESLEQIVVIGYGTARKKDVTGAVSLISNETIEDLRPVEVSQALQGTVSGVRISSSSGSPGAKLNIAIRGVGSNQSNDPLVIIDGYRGDLTTINPNDVESVTILKDSQAAIYGIDGANGVVLVTTKRGRKNQKPTFSYDTFTGFQETTRKLPLLNATEYGALLNESYAAAGEDLPFPDLSGLGEGTDWQDLIFDTSPIFSHNLSFSGGTEKITYFVGGSHIEQEGIVAKETSEYRRNTARLALGVDISEKFDFNTTINYINSNRKAISNSIADDGEIEEFGLGGLLFNAINYAPVFSEDEDDVNGFLGSEVINPISQRNNMYNDIDANGLEGMTSLDYTPFDGLKITSRIGFRTFTNSYKRFFPIVDYGSSKVFNTDRSSVVQGTTTTNDYTFETFANYNTTIAEDHNLDVVLGMSAQRKVYTKLEATGFDVPNNSIEFADISLADGINEAKTAISERTDQRRSSTFGRVQYDFKKRYLFSGILRRDVASDFIEDNRVDYFPSVTTGWNISEEPFWNQDGFVNFLKVRGSYGLLGSNVGSDLYRASLDGEATYVIDGVLVSGVANGRIPNIEAQWEVAKKLDIGLDVKMLNNSIEIVADYFKEDREDLLIANSPVSGITGSGAPGAGFPTINGGTSSNEGFEFLISYKDSFSENFSFGISYNVSYIENNVTEINGDVILEGGNFGVGQLSPSRMEVGQPIGYFYGLQTNGIFQNQAEVDAHPSQIELGAEAAPGDIRFVDVNNDGVINFDDRTNIGDPIPDWYMGLNLNLKYKQFDFSAYSYANLGQEMVRNYERDQPNVNRLDLYLDRWRGEGTSNSVPRATVGTTTNKLFSEFYVEDASFLRIQNVQLGYSLPTEFLNTIGINRLRVYTAINNLYTFTDYTGYDPAATSSGAIGAGIDDGFYPVSRQYLFGLNLNF
ncbi:SusC/RagA family TonB-linked outer membrane protein [Aquimarina pacifica]|uniref:SusC/RagA family TonB-linked outer membrane protein n=1 Tax=Aquimarina pacifica TaxID=1296415 RepID=UPI000472EA9F|nr:TonB-dependent receptor [Aquimarina pacifica]